MVDNPPHMLFFRHEDPRLHFFDALSTLHDSLPETHVFLFCEAARYFECLDHLKKGVFEVLILPLVHPDILVHSVDRAATLDYYMYKRESEQEALQAPGHVSLEIDLPSQIDIPALPNQDEGKKSSAPPALKVEPQVEGPSVVDIRNFAKTLYRTRNFDQCVESYFGFLSQLSQNVPFLFFRFVANRKLLILHSYTGTHQVDKGKVGIDFKGRSGFTIGSLRDPQSLVELKDFLSEFFGVRRFSSWPFECGGEIWGLFVCLKPEALNPQHDDFRLARTMLERHVRLLEVEKKLHTSLTRDDATEVLNRHSFLVEIEHEVVRSRRTKLPTSLILVTIDQFGDVLGKVGPEEGDLLLRNVARIFETNSRVNDVIGRLGSDEFALLLPHTPKEGALVKAERLRRIVEGADFSQLIESIPRLTISSGLSEYPSVCRDADELVQAADQALFKVRSKKNRIGIAKPPEGFSPDFQPEVKITHVTSKSN